MNQPKDIIDDDKGFRMYQEKVQNKIPKDHLRYYIQYAEKYIKQGVIPQEAKVLAHFSILAEVELEKVEKSSDIFDRIDDMGLMKNFIIDNNGHIIELYLHYAQRI